jgi:hypothetical protein
MPPGIRPKLERPWRSATGTKVGLIRLETSTRNQTFVPRAASGQPTQAAREFARRATHVSSILGTSVVERGCEADPWTTSAHYQLS